ncbi:hypothetical protein KGQ27_02000 [Patescibacteria group bacterium]|nr:hypothetical protein [Patescibacteria group bacterium]MDE1946309.1 hypothetical protein [Patescibacteria group bacterium]MDE2010761.1 hypothetical protein [Patescibacteria group bacterium]
MAKNGEKVPATGTYMVEKFLPNSQITLKDTEFLKWHTGHPKKGVAYSLEVYALIGDELRSEDKWEKEIWISNDGKILTEKPVEKPAPVPPTPPPPTPAPEPTKPVPPVPPPSKKLPAEFNIIKTRLKRIRDNLMKIEAGTIIPSGRMLNDMAVAMDEMGLQIDSFKASNANPEWDKLQEVVSELRRHHAAETAKLASRKPIPQPTPAPAPTPTVPPVPPTTEQQKEESHWLVRGMTKKLQKVVGTGWFGPLVGITACGIIVLLALSIKDRLTKKASKVSNAGPATASVVTPAPSPIPSNTGGSVDGNGNFIVVGHGNVVISGNSNVVMINGEPARRSGSTPTSVGDNQTTAKQWPKDFGPTRVIKPAQCLVDSGIDGFTLPETTVYAGDDVEVVIPNGWGLGIHMSANADQYDAALDGKIVQPTSGEVKPTGRIPHKELRLRLRPGVQSSTLRLKFDRW